MNNSKNHIFIIGMMGSGKSSIAPLLSSKMNIPYVDTDADLVEIMDAEIKEIFTSLTKEKFYHLESTYFLEHIKNTQHIYATGGGLVLNKNNRLALSQYGITIFLDTPIDLIYQRLRKDEKKERPLFIKSPNKKNLNQIWNERKKYYTECADLVTNTENKSLDIIAQEIIEYINQ